MSVPSASSSFSQSPEMRGSLYGRWQQLVTFPAGFLFDFLGIPAEEIVNGNNMIVGHLTTDCMCEQVFKCPKCIQVTAGGGVCDVLCQLEVLYELYSIIFETMTKWSCKLRTTYTRLQFLSSGVMYFV